MQLDIFEHSRDVMLRNDVISALERHDAAAARAACDLLAQECPADESLPLCVLCSMGWNARTAARSAITPR